MKISNLNIGLRLGLAFAVVVALLIGTAGVGIANLAASNDKMNHIVNDRYSLIALSNQIKNNGYKGNALLSNILLASTLESSKKYMDEYVAVRNANATAYAQLEKLIQTPEAKVIYQQQITARSAYGVAVRKFFEVINAGNLQQARELYQGDVAKLQVEYNVWVDKMVDHMVDQMNKDTAQAASDAANAQLEMIVLSIAAAAIAIVTGFLITRTITYPIQRAVTLAEAVAQGDLTHELASDSKDEIGRLLRALQIMIENLHRIVARVRVGTDTIDTASKEVARGNMDLSSRTEQQASSLEETASAMEQLTAAVKQNAENAQQANTLARSASAIATQGGVAVEQVVSTMNSINSSSQKIVEIISVIDGIAFQTNILALNAAVEAARAGEHGRGFAVVASEVRSLAQRSAVAAKEIKSLIDDSVMQVGSGSQIVVQAGQTINEVVTSIKHVTDIVGDISASSHEQSRDIEQINLAITEMDQVTQQNAALVEQSAAAAQTMQSQASRLTDVMAAFKLNSGHVPVALNDDGPGSYVGHQLLRDVNPDLSLPAETRVPQLS